MLLQQGWVFHADVLIWLLPMGMQTNIRPHQVGLDFPMLCGRVLQKLICLLRGAQ